MNSNQPGATAPIRIDTVVGFVATFMVVCTAVTILRMFTRMRVHRELWWDDCEHLTAEILPNVSCTEYLTSQVQGRQLSRGQAP